MNKKYIYNIISVLIYLIVIINNKTNIVKADNTGTSVDARWYSGDTVGGVSCNYGMCQDSQKYNYEFRITLVDKEGKRIPGTKSVDYGYNYNGYVDNKTTKASRAGKENIYDALYSDYKYKYGDNDAPHDYYKVNLVNGIYNSYSTYSEFTYDFKNVIKTRTKKFGIENGTTGNFDFITMFLYHCGYLNHNSGEAYYDIENEHWNDKHKELAKNDYYIIIEPIFSIFGNYNMRGTSKELAIFLKTLGPKQTQNLNAITLHQMGMGMFTTLADAQELEFSKITQKEYIFQNSGVPDAKVIEEWNVLTDESYGNGMGLVRLKQIISEPEEEIIDINIQENYCQTTGTGSNNGIIKFEVTKGLDTEKTFQDSKSAGYKFKNYDSVNSTIYCYDDVTYDFSNMIDSLNQTTIKTSTYSVIPTGTIRVNRHCKIINTREFEYGIAEENFINNFKDYENQKIDLNIFNNKISLKKINIDIIKDKTRVVSQMKIYAGTYHTTATITFGYTENDSKVYVNKNYGDGTAYVDLSNVTFGYSNDLKNQVQDGQEYTYDKYIFKTHVTSSGNSMKCSFKTTVENLDTSDLIKFRTISLDNPFPSRDATSRLPGSNWLGKDNFVGTYINNNRGVTGSAVYNKEPIYTITLTPSQMVKIREYNKKHSYNDLDLNCVGENNTSCLSNFLRTTINEENIKGSCMINSDNIIKDPNHIGQYNMDDVVKTIINTNEKGNPFKLNETNSMYDFNKDGVLSLRDAYIYDNAEKTTNYYTCADKTYENSGYVKEVSVNE